MWVRDYPFVLYMIRNLKIISSKAVECLQKLKRRQQGSWSLFLSFFFFLKKERQRWSADNMNEWTHCNIFLGHRGSFMSCMAYAWNISPCGDECVCVLSIIVGADECEVKHIYNQQHVTHSFMLGKSLLSHLSQGTCQGVIASRPDQHIRI